MSMGRKPTVNNHLPPHMRARRQKSGKTYYYLDLGGKPRVEKPLGDDYALALQQWSHLNQHKLPAASVVTFKMACDKYIKDILPSKSANTQKDYLKCLKQISVFFNNPPAPINEIEAKHIRQYLDWRGATSTKRANAECSVISTIFNHARGWGYTNNVNPCQGVKRFTENKRSIYIEDNIYQAIYDCACEPLKDALDLGYLTAQRPIDVINMYETDIKDGALLVQQSKTGAKLQIAITGTLKTVIERILSRRTAFKVRSLALILDEYGKPLSQRAIWARFDKARDKAIALHPPLKDDLAKFQIRDLRAKAGTDKTNEDDIRTAQKLLGHSNVAMTERYVRKIIGEKVNPTK